VTGCTGRTLNVGGECLLESTSQNIRNVLEWRVTGYTGRLGTASVGGEYQLESISQNIRDDYECRATGCMVRTPSVGGGYPLESTS